MKWNNTSKAILLLPLQEKKSLFFFKKEREWEEKGVHGGISGHNHDRDIIIIISPSSKIKASH